MYISNLVCNARFWNTLATATYARVILTPTFYILSARRIRADLKSIGLMTQLGTTLELSTLGSSSRHNTYRYNWAPYLLRPVLHKITISLYTNLKLFMQNIKRKYQVYGILSIKSNKTTLYWELALYSNAHLYISQYVLMSLHSNRMDFFLICVCIYMYC